jgi:hypothetical protein
LGSGSQEEVANENGECPTSRVPARSGEGAAPQLGSGLLERNVDFGVTVGPSFQLLGERSGRGTAAQSAGCLRCAWMQIDNSSVATSFALLVIHNQHRAEGIE